MSFYFTPWIISPLLSALLNGYLAVYAWPRRKVPAAGWFFWLAVGMSGWALFYALNTAAVELTSKNLFFKTATIFFDIVLFTVLPMTLVVMGRTKPFSRLVIALLAVIPVTSTVLALTNDLHGLMRLNLHIVNTHGMHLMGFQDGRYFKLMHQPYVYLYHLLVIVLCLVSALRRGQSRRGGLVMILVATLIPLTTDMFNISPVKELKLATSALFLSGIFYWLAVFRHQLLNLVPVANAALFRQMQEPVLVVDNQAHLAEYNQAAQQQLKLSSDARGKSLDNLFPHEHPFHGVLGIVNDELRHDYLNERWWQISQTRLRQGVFDIGWILVLHDVTDFKVMEQRMQETLAFEQELRKEHESFLSMISHEYRTPLAIIQANLDLIELMEDDTESRYAPRISAMKQGVNRLVEILEISLDQMKMTILQEDSETKRITLITLLDAVMDKAEAFWPDRLFVFQPEITSEAVMGNNIQLKTAVLNLLDNACKYSPDNTPVLLECRAEGQMATITVTNQGSGFPTHETAELFEKFQRGSNSIGTSGAGVGLWLVQRIVKRHGGSVLLEHDIEKGIQVTLLLPLAE